MTALQFLLKSAPDHQVPGQPARPRFGEGTRDGSAGKSANPGLRRRSWSRSKGKPIMGLPLFLKPRPRPAQGGVVSRKLIQPDSITRSINPQTTAAMIVVITSLRTSRGLLGALVAWPGSAWSGTFTPQGSTVKRTS